jgi:hypothetical protein
VAERSSISQSVQIGVESTPGTPVAASKRLQSIGFKLGPKVDSKANLPIGQKYPNLVVVGKEWSEAELSGMPVYTELPYIFSSLMSTATSVTETMDSAIHTGGFVWTFDSLSFGDDTPKTYTLEQGSSARAHRVSNGIITSLSLDWSRDETKIGGTLLAQALTDGITMTGSPTSLAQVPVRPTHWSVYLDDTAAGLGGTKLTRALKGNIKISDRFGPLWVVDAAQNSFVNTVEIEPKVTFNVMQMADAAAMANLTAMRNGSTKFLRLEAVGPNIYTNGGVIVNNTFRLDLAGQIGDIEPFEDSDGVYAITWDFSAVNDSTWGKAYQVKVTTTTAAL